MVPMGRSRVGGVKSSSPGSGAEGEEGGAFCWNWTFSGLGVLVVEGLLASLPLLLLA